MKELYQRFYVFLQEDNDFLYTKYMIPQQYAYLVGTLLFFIPWTILFFHRKDLRKEMLVMGGIGAVGMLVTQYFWTVDWWRPLTITNTRIGIEDALLGFNNAGIAAVLYEELFRKRFYKRTKTHDKQMILFVILTCVLFVVLFKSLSLSSFTSCVIALSVFV